MKSMEENLQDGLNYLIPLRWWRFLNEINPSPADLEPQSNSSTCQFPSIRSYIHTYTLDYQQHIRKAIQPNSKRGRIDHMHITPQIKNNKKWKIINPQTWHYIQSLTQQHISIPVIYDTHNPHSYLEQSPIQLQLLFSSEQKTDLFVGFFPPNQNLALIVGEVGKMLGFSNFSNSRVVHIHQQFAQEFTFQYLTILTSKQLHSTIQIRGLYHQSQPYYQSMSQPLKPYQNEGTSNDPISLSTKVDTPRIYAIQENTQTSRIKKVLQSSKHPEEIEFLREKVEKALNDPKIEILLIEEEELRTRLQQLAIESVSRIGKE